MPEPDVLEPQPSPAQAVTEPAAASAAAEVEAQPEPSAERGGVQRRIDELTKARRLAEAESEFWRTKALAAPTPAAASADKLKAKPSAADFETTEAYLDARDTWVLTEASRLADEKVQKASQAYEQRSEQEILTGEWTERESAVQETHPDYEAVTAQAMDSLQSSKGPATAAIAHAVQYSESGPELLYYLGQHPEEVERLSRLHPTQAVIGLGRIEGRLVDGVAPGRPVAAPPQTKAPRPPAPIRKSSGATAVDPNDPTDADRMSTEEWRAARNAKLRGR
jgi:hypothetical protein